MSVSDKYQRYQRQILLKEFGIAGQAKLLKAKLLVVGAGGLGCPALQYLVAAGVGTIGIIDFDVVEISNLQRQVLYSVNDVGKFKAETAAKKLKSLNPEIKFQTSNLKLQTSNALELISGYDLVIDGSDNFSTRYLINDACVLLKKPLVYGSVFRFEGQAGVFNLADKDTNIITNYRDLFPEPPAPASAPSCTEAGVLGVLPGIIGTLQAAEAIKIITGIGKPLCNKVVSYNCLNNLFYEFAVSPAEKTNSSIPETETDFLNFDYEWFCGSHREPFEISAGEFDTLRRKEEITIIDVREKDELPFVDEFLFTQIPFSSFEEAIPGISTKNKLVIFCQSGNRSLRAVKMLIEKFPGHKAWSLEGGIEAWKKVNAKISV